MILHVPLPLDPFVLPNDLFVYGLCAPLSTVPLSVDCAWWSCAQDRAVEGDDQ